MPKSTVKKKKEPAPLTANELKADAYMDLVLNRTGLKPEQLVCPREKSEMTPCIARDGHLALTDRYDNPVCVGCEHGLNTLMEAEPRIAHQDHARELGEEGDPHHG
jgi:hypothetical protein